MIKEIFIKNFSLDSRSLALFRVGLGLTLLTDYLFTRWPYADLFYFRNGLNSPRLHASSLAFIYSADWFQLLLMLSAVLCFCLLIVGYKTKYTAFTAWALVVSMHVKNDMIVNAGDVLGCLLLFWSLPLPSNKHFSFDSAVKKPKPSQHFSLFSIYFIGQILLVYWITFLFKNHPVWKNGDAVYYALMLDSFRTYWGDILLQYPYLMKFLTFMTYRFIEGAVPLLLLCFGFAPRARVFLIFIMAAFHLSLSVFLHLGMFSYFCILMWLALLPSEFWDHLKKYFPQKPLIVYFDDSCSFCRKSVHLLKTFLILPHVTAAAAQSKPEALSEMNKRNSWLVWDQEKGWQSHFSAFAEIISRSPLFFYLSPFFRLRFISFLGNKIYNLTAKNRHRVYLDVPEEFPPLRKKNFLLYIFYSFCFLYTAAWNIRALDFKYWEKYFPQKYNSAGFFLHLTQHWSMFAPYPSKKGGYIILSASRKDDTKIDLWRNGEPEVVTSESPYRYDETFPVFRFRKMLENIVSYKRYRRTGNNYLRYLCRKWNKKLKDNPITKIELIYMRIDTPEPGQPKPPAKKKMITSFKCRSP